MGAEYTVTADCLELERGTSFYVFPAPVRPGQLVLFEVEGRKGVGRYLSVDGHEFFLLPGQLIDVAHCQFRILGVVVVADAKKICLN